MMKKDNSQQYSKDHCLDALRQTLLYAHIFNYPLKRNELWYYLKTHVNIKKSDFYQMLNFIPEDIESVDGYYFFTGYRHGIKDRKKRESFSNTKIFIAKNVTKLLSIIPTILYVGISGSLSMRNAGENDDIDLFIITKKNSLWSTRLLILLILQLLGMRRSRNSNNRRNKICVNMLIDETQLTFAKNRRDIYTSQEIAQLKTLYSRDNTAYKFYLSNEWIKKFMPNILPNLLKNKEIYKSSQFLVWIFRILGSFLLPIIIFEKVAEAIQLWSINKNQTNEYVTSSFVAFHPFDYRELVLKKYNSILIDHHLSFTLTLYSNIKQKYKNTHSVKEKILSVESLNILNKI